MSDLGYKYDSMKEVIDSRINQVKRNRNKGILSAFVLAIIIFVGMTIYFLYIGNDLNYGAIFGSSITMFLIVFLVQLKMYFSEMASFEGTVYKTRVKKKDMRKNEDYSIYRYYYVLYIKKSSGGKRKYELCEVSKPNEYWDRVLNYYDGARIKKYPAIDLPEKYDKTGDKFKICILDGKINKLEDSYCIKCGSPL